MKKPALLSLIPILCTLLAAGCATGNPAGDAFGNWVGGMMIAEAGRPQVTVNNVQPQAAAQAVGAGGFDTGFRLTDGSVYSGSLELLNGTPVPHGKGKIRYPILHEYSGGFEYGKRNGQGTLTDKSGSRWEGDWKEDNLVRGSFTAATGDRYEGEWKDGKMHGFGKMTFADGKVQEGIWRNDKFVSAQTAPSASPTPSAGKQGSVSINSNEEEAEVLVDGSFVGNAPAKLKLAEGTHVIEVKKDGYKPFKKEIKVTEGSELNLRAVLQKQ